MNQIISEKVLIIPSVQPSKRGICLYTDDESDIIWVAEYDLIRKNTCIQAKSIE